MAFGGGLAAALAALALFWPVVTFVVHEQVDYANHLGYLRDALDGGSVGTLLSYFPHFLYHALVYLAYRLGLSLADASLAVTAAGYSLGALAVYAALVVSLGRPKTPWALAGFVSLALALMLVMPFNLVTPDNLYLGYIVIHAYHNPTMVMLKPLALLVWVSAAGALSERGWRPPLWSVALLAGLCVMAKSSYALALLPALGVMTAGAVIRRQSVAWVRLAAVALPVLALLVVQAVWFRNTGGIILAPLAVMRAWAGAINPLADDHLLLKLVLSALFPAATAIVCWPAARRDRHLHLAWLAFGLGAFYTYFLAESGERLGHANFTWSGQITLFILFVASSICAIRFIRESSGARRGLLLAAIFGLHLVSGWHWYQIHMNAAWMGDIIANRW